MRGLNLIRLLTQNRIADFHATLESLPLPADAISDNPYLSHPVNLERWLMEGSYSKVWNARAEAPAEEYKFFVDSLMGTIRFVIKWLSLGTHVSSSFFSSNEIASCEEAAYESLPLKDAATLLFFNSQSELLTFAQQVESIVANLLFPMLNFVVAWVASQSLRIHDYLRAEGRRADGNTERKAYICVAKICQRARDDCVEVGFVFAMTITFLSA